MRRAVLRDRPSFENYYGMRADPRAIVRHVQNVRVGGQVCSWNPACNAVKCHPMSLVTLYEKTKTLTLHLPPELEHPLIPEAKR